jgi:DNA repair protein RadA/Sms
MPRATTTFVCSSCGGESLRWAGQCPHCRAWNTLQEFTIKAQSRAERSAAARPLERPRALPINQVPEDSAPRIPLAWEEVNRVLGGGVVAGSLVLVGGEPGVGKSTLLMHVAQQVAERGGIVLYASGEESAQQVRMRAARLGALAPALQVLAENDLDAITDAIVELRPALAIVDSIQTVYDAGLEAAAGSVTQVREGAAALMRTAKQTGIPIFLVGHVTKEGAIAGPRVLEHIVDCVLYLEGERRLDFRVLRATKNRFGSTEEIGIFSMTEAGLQEVGDASAALLAGSSLDAVGTAVVATLEGSRPLLVELQTLVTGTGIQMPRRSANGFDLNRLHMLLAVIENRVGGLKVGDKDVFVNVAAGIRVSEPAADLALALSVAGNLRKQALPEATVVIGELGLVGEVRRVNQLEKRLAEAVRHGFKRAMVPRANSVRPSGLELLEVGSLKEAVAIAFASAVPSALNSD